MSGEEQSRFKELRSRRAVAWLSEESILHAADRADGSYHVLAVFADPLRPAIGVLLVSPELPVVPDGEVPPDIKAEMVSEYRVIDGLVWHRSRLTVEQVENIGGEDVGFIADGS